MDFISFNGNGFGASFFAITSGFAGAFTSSLITGAAFTTTVSSGSFSFFKGSKTSGNISSGESFLFLGPGMN